MTEQQAKRTHFGGTAKGEREWWYNLARQLAGEHWIDAVTEDAFRRGLTPLSAANLMKAEGNGNA